MSLFQVSAEETVGENEPSKRYTISFVPVDVGDHSIEVILCSVPIVPQVNPFRLVNSKKMFIVPLKPNLQALMKWELSLPRRRKTVLQ